MFPRQRVIPSLAAAYIQYTDIYDIQYIYTCNIQHICMYIYIYIYIYMCVCVCVCVCIHISMYTCVCRYIDICIYIYISRRGGGRGARNLHRRVQRLLHGNLRQGLGFRYTRMIRAMFWWRVCNGGHQRTCEFGLCGLRFGVSQHVMRNAGQGSGCSVGIGGVQGLQGVR
jgi:hypothetical protein